MTSEPDGGLRRISSLGISDKRPNVLGVTGGLSHGSDISFDKANAQKLIKFLQNMDYQSKEVEQRSEETDDEPGGLGPDDSDSDNNDLPGYAR